MKNGEEGEGESDTRGPMPSPVSYIIIHCES